MSITHNKKRILLLNYLLIAYQQDQHSKIYRKDESTFRFLDFLIIGLCNSSVNSWFCIISLLAAPP